MISQEPDRPARAERRYAPRAPSSLLVRLGNGLTRAEAFCADISMGGVLLQRELPAAIAYTHLYLDVALQLPGDPRPIRAMARRVWSRGNSFGLRFLKMSELDRLRLAEHIDRATRAPGSSP